MVWCILWVVVVVGGGYAWKHPSVFRTRQVSVPQLERQASLPIRPRSRDSIALPIPTLSRD